MKKRAIICVDDEKVVLLALKEQLKTNFPGNFLIETAESAEEAIGLIKELQEKKIDIPIIIADHLMPGTKGDALLIAARDIAPNTLKILLTGQATADAVGNTVNKANLYRYISKPWEKDDLILTLKEAIRIYDREKQLARINVMSRKVNSLLNMDELLDFLLNESIHILEADGGYLFMRFFPPRSKEFTKSTSAEISSDDYLKSICSEVLSKLKMVYRNDHDKSVKSVIAVPIKRGEKAEGVISFWRNHEDTPFTADDGRIIEILMAQGSSAIENAFLFEEQKKTENQLRNNKSELEKYLDQLRTIVDAIIQAMSMILEKRDPYTAGHQRRVSVLAEAIAAEMDLPKDSIEAVKFASIIHDIGKISIPAEILSKPGKLDEMEFILIKQHAKAGYEIWRFRLSCGSCLKTWDIGHHLQPAKMEQDR
ncbi:MAG: response regulator, partial [Spirochaetales bacterium]|nr:response regulator [Spirochaetales bacterium]